MPDAHQAHMTAPDLSIEDAKYPFHCPSMLITFRNLPHVRPNVLWIFGSRSPINGASGSQDAKMAQTGNGIGGSGGAQMNKVKRVVVEGGGHLLPFEMVDRCASILAEWLEHEIADFARVERFWRDHDSGRSERERMAVSKLWLKNVRMDPGKKRADKARL